MSASGESSNGPRHGGKVLIDQLALHGCDTVFCVPGESYLAALDGLYDRQDIRTIVCRQEGGAAMMAEAYGRLSGVPGVCLVTRGPGATNASPAVHVAQQGATPLILLVGQVPRAFRGRDAFQEVDYRELFGGMAKWVFEVEDPGQLPESIRRAFDVATARTPGPVVVSLPEDVLNERLQLGDASPWRPVQVEAREQDLLSLQRLLAAAERPLLVVGGSEWSQETAQRVMGFAERSGIAVCSEFRCQDYFDNEHPCYAGDLGLAMDPALAQTAGDADVVVLLGGRLGQMSNRRYTLVKTPQPKQTLIHVHPDPTELGRLYRPRLGICSSPGPFAQALHSLHVEDRLSWRSWTASARQAYLERTSPPTTTAPAGADFAHIVCWLRDNLPPDAILTNGAGLYTVTLQRYYRFRTFRTQLAPQSGSMGYGLPAAIAAKLRHPEREVVCFAGDGCLLMSVQELATVQQLRLKLIVVVVNNSSYGTIREHQRRSFPGRGHATDLENPDFASFARSFGMGGEIVSATADFAPAFERARTSERATLLEVRTAR